MGRHENDKAVVPDAIQQRLDRRPLEMFRSAPQWHGVESGQVHVVDVAKQFLSGACNQLGI